MERKQKIAKKIVLVAIFLAIALESAVAKNFTNDGGEGKAIDFRQPTVITSGKNYASIAGILKNNLEEVWLNYSNMQIVASDHEKRSTDIQKKSESALYSEKTAIESGNFVIQNFTADTKIFISEKGTFRATIRIVDNEKNSVVANYETEEFENEDSFCTYAANDIAINVMPKLGIELTTNAKSILSYRKNNPNETVQEAQLYYSNISVSIDEIDEKISAIEKTKMDAQTAIAEKSRLEAEKKQRLMQQEEARKRLERLKEEERKREADKNAAKERDAQLNKKIEEQSALFDALAKEKRKELSSESSGNMKISILEKKKAALKELRDMSVAKIIEFGEQEDADLQAKIKSIQEEPYSSIELDAKGKPTQDAKKARKERIASAKKESDNRKKQFVSDQKSLTKNEDDAILADINADIEILKNPQIESSLLNDEVLKFGTFDGTKGKEGWDTYITLIVAGQLISSEKIHVPYKTITGIAPNKNTKDSRQEYENNVTEYSSYFARKVPVLYVNINYSIRPHPNGHPSQYQVSILSYDFYRIDNPNPIMKVGSKVINRKVSVMPAIDVKINGETSQYELEVMILNTAKNTAKKAKEAAKKAKETGSSGAQKAGEFIATGVGDVGANLAFGTRQIAFGLDGDYLFPIPYVYLGPSLEMNFGPNECLFNLGAMVFKGFAVEEVTLYVAGAAGLQLITIAPYAGFYANAEFGVIYYKGLATFVRLGFDIQPTFNANIGMKYFFNNTALK